MVGAAMEYVLQRDAALYWRPMKGLQCSVMDLLVSLGRVADPVLKRRSLSMLYQMLLDQCMPLHLVDTVLFAVLEYLWTEPHSSLRTVESDTSSAQCLMLLFSSHLSPSAISGIALHFLDLLPANFIGSSSPHLRYALLHCLYLIMTYCDSAIGSASILISFLGSKQVSALEKCLKLAIESTLSNTGNSVVVKSAKRRKTDLSENSLASPFLVSIFEDLESRSWELINKDETEAEKWALSLYTSIRVCSHFIDKCPFASLVTKLIVSLKCFISLPAAQTILRPKMKPALFSLVDALIYLLKRKKYKLEIKELELVDAILKLYDSESNLEWELKKLDILTYLDAPSTKSAQQYLVRYQSFLVAEGELGARAFQRLPAFLFKLAASVPNAHASLFPSLFSYLQKQIENKKLTRLEDYMQVVGWLACVSAGTVSYSNSFEIDEPDDLTDFAKFRTPDQHISTNPPYPLSCTVCDSSHAKKIFLEAPTALFEGTIDPWNALLSLLHSDSQIQAKCALLRSLPRILFHLKKEQIQQACNYLKLLQDPSAEIRHSTSQAILPFLRTSSSTDSLLTILETLESTDQNVETRVDCYYTIGGYLEGKHLRFAIESCLCSLFEENTDVGAAAYDTIRQIQRIYDPAGTLSSFLDSFSQQLAPKILKDPNQLQAMAQALFDCYPNEYISSTLHITLPEFILEASDQSLEAIRYIAQSLSRQIGDLIFEQLHNIIALILMHTDMQRIEKAFKVLKEFIPEKETTELVVGCLRKLLGTLIISLGGSPEKRIQANRALEIVAQYNDQENISLFLRNHFFAFMTEINPILLGSPNFTERMQALDGLEQLIKLLGSELNSVRPAIMITLKLALQEKKLQNRSLEIWNNFILQLDVNSVGPILSQIVVDTLSYVETAPNTVFRILNYLIITKYTDMCRYFGDIPFIPDLPILKSIKETVEKETRRELPDELKQLIRGIENENGNVRAFALERLKLTLSEKADEINKLIVEKEGIDGTISSLLKALLGRTRDSSVRCRELTASCLGELGAIDTGRVDPMLAMHQPAPAAQYELPHEDMAVELVNQYLVKALIAASDTSAQTRSGAAIQEILRKVLHCNTDTYHKCSAWQRFSSDTIEIIQPYLTTQYRINSPPAAPSPIYKAEQPYKTWISAWVGQLIARTAPDTGGIYRACYAVARADMNTAHYLFPSLILHSLKHGSDDTRQQILLEILAVLTASDDHPSAHVGQRATQTVFMLIDFLNKICEQKRGSKKPTADTTSTPSKRTRRETIENTDVMLTHIEKLLGNIPQELLAMASVRCKAYARALRHLELAIRHQIAQSNKSKIMVLTEYSSRLQQIYSGIEEPDGLVGIAVLRLKTSQLEEAVDHENSGRWHEALNCYEQAMKLDPNVLSYRIGKLNCLRTLGQWHTIIDLVDGAANKLNDPKSKDALMGYGIQAAWRLGHWDQVHRYSQLITLAPDFDVSIARLLFAVRALNTNNNNNNNNNGNTRITGEEISRSEAEAEFQRLLQATRTTILEPLAAASMESYVRCYPSLLKLHLLKEIELAASNDFTLGKLNSRLKLMQPNFKTQEAVITIRSVLLKLHNLESEVSSNWLQLGKLAKKAGQIQFAEDAFFQASNVDAQRSNIERAKLIWESGQHSKALQMILNGKTNIDSVDRKAKAKILLLAAQWQQHTGQKKATEIIKEYEEAIKVQPEWEKGYFMLGRYCDQLLTAQKHHLRASQPSHKITDLKSEYLPLAIDYYGKSLNYGHRYLYHSLPRMLTIWFEYTVISTQPTAKSAKSKAGDYITKASILLQSHVSMLPGYQWLTCISQLISHIAHRNNDVFGLLMQIVQKTLLSYPHQTLWSMVGVLHSISSEERKNRASKILDSANPNDEVKMLIQQMKKLAPQLINICNYSITKGIKSFSLSATGPADHINKNNTQIKLPRQLTLIIPLQSSLTVSLPASGRTEKNHTPFGELVSISRFQDTVEVLSSMQRPRKIFIHGSDARDYPFLCKPKDDLRRDCRMNELNSMINKLLQKDPESRRRKLNVRTYGVVPLNEECGLIEWVPNTIGYRWILNSLYGESYYSSSFKAIKQVYDEYAPPKSANPKHPPPDVFAHRILPLLPPRFHEWFLLRFPEPNAWFDARQAFTRTTAVMSMIGFVVGLGDRHGENILLDANTGDAVHVDFNCLFGKGKTLVEPERVPFRLTSNMVDAMGVTDYEGTFRSACEITLSVLRNNHDSLMSVLETFISDPLVEITKTKNGANVDEHFEKMGAIIEEIDKAIQGKSNEDQTKGLRIPVAGQVHQLIEEATAYHNLCEMYVGWNAWL